MRLVVYVIRCSSFSFMCYCWWIRRLYAAPTRSSKGAWDPVTSQQGLCTETTEPTIGLMVIKAFSYLSANRRQTRWQLNCEVSYLQIQYRSRKGLGVTIKLCFPDVWISVKVVRRNWHRTVSYKSWKHGNAHSDVTGDKWSYCIFPTKRFNMLKFGTWFADTFCIRMKHGEDHHQTHSLLVVLEMLSLNFEEMSERT